jgi:transposase, IS5 family
MKSLIDFALKDRYAKVKNLRPRLEEVKKIIDWEKFVPLFPERKSLVGRPNYEKILMVRIAILQGWYALSDEELEFQINDRLSFQQFLDFPENIPDYSTIWRFREELSQCDITDKIWDELQRQIAEKGIIVEKGHIQDASFVIADPGKTRSGMDRRGQVAKTSRNRDGSWTKKGKKSYFGYKVHTKTQRGSKIVETLAVTTARIHDNAIDLATANDVIYRDKGYSGTKTVARGDATMKRGNLTVKEILRNKRIQKKRNQGEHPYATVSRALHGRTTKLTTVQRVFVQQVFVFIAYNLYRLATLIKM